MKSLTSMLGTCWIDEVLDGAGMKSHTFMLGTFFIYTLALHNTYADFQEKIFPETSGKKFGAFSKTFQGRFFLENQHTKCQGIYKKTSST